MTPPGRDKNIDSVLEHFDTNMFVTTKEVESIVGESERHNTISQMLSIGIFQLMQDTIATNGGGLCYILTAFGVEVKQHGSWTKYLIDKEDEKKANRQLIDSSIGANWLNKWLLIATAVFSFLALGISTADFMVHKKELRVSKAVLQLQREELQKQQHDSLTCSCQGNKASRQTNPKTDSLDKGVK